MQTSDLMSTDGTVSRINASIATDEGKPSAPTDVNVKCWPKSDEAKGVPYKGPPAVGEYLDADSSLPFAKNCKGVEPGAKKKISAMTRFYYGRNVTGFMPPQPKSAVEQVKEFEKAADEIIAARNAEQVDPVPPTMKQINEALQRKQKEGKHGPVGLLTSAIKGETSTKGERKEGEKDEEEIRVVDHRVQREDTYRRLALRYHTTVKVIKKWNRIKSRSLDNMIGRVLEIPVGRTFVDFVRDPTNEKVVLQQLVKAFMQQARGCCNFRANFYLQNNDLDLKAALQEWKDDTEWEAQQTDGPLAERLAAEKKKGKKDKKTG